MKVYYINSEVHKVSLQIACQKARTLIEFDKNIKTVTFLLGQKSQFNLLYPLGFTKKQVDKQKIATSNGLCVQFQTLKTYHPNYIFGNNKSSEILISVLIPPKYLYRYEDYSDIAYWIIVPWTLSENESFLSIHEAEDCENGNLLNPPSDVDYKVANALDWLFRTSFPNEGYHHPNDENRLKNIAVKLRDMQVPVEYDSIVYYCLHHNFIPSSARKTADYIMRAQSHSMRISDLYSGLERIINAPRNNNLDEQE